MIRLEAGARLCGGGLAFRNGHGEHVRGDARSAPEIFQPGEQIGAVGRPASSRGSCPADVVGDGGLRGGDACPLAIQKFGTRLGAWRRPKRPKHRHGPNFWSISQIRRADWPALCEIPLCTIGTPVSKSQ
jgi:hypothetical protein